MKTKVLTLLLILFPGIVYLEWGGGNQNFLWQAELEILQKALHHPKELLHPFIVIPLLGQCILLFTLFQKVPSRRLIFSAIAAISILVVFICFIGVMGLKAKIFLSTIPFLCTATITIIYLKRSKSNQIKTTSVS